MIKYMMVLISLSLGMAFVDESNASTYYRRCIRISFASKDLGTMTNLCNLSLYATWLDDNGEYTTAIGKNASSNIGHIHGRFQIKDAELQNNAVSVRTGGLSNSRPARSCPVGQETVCGNTDCTVLRCH